MVKKDYFPTQEVPSWVKDKVMNKIKEQPKRFRLLSMIRLRIFVPVSVFLFVAIGWYLYLYNNKTPNIAWIIMSGYQNERYTENPVVMNNSWNISGESNPLLQQRLAEVEILLNDLSAYADKEEDITL